MVFVFYAPVSSDDLESLSNLEVFITQVVSTVDGFLACLFIFFFVSAFIDALYAGKANSAGARRYLSDTADRTRLLPVRVLYQKGEQIDCS